MVVFGRSSRRVAATSVVFAVSVAGCASAAGMAVADPQPMPDRWMPTPPTLTSWSPMPDRLNCLR